MKNGFSTNFHIGQFRAWSATWLAVFMAFWLLAAGSPAIAADAKQDFPRLSGIQIGKTPYEGGITNPEYQRKMARLDLVILGSTAKSVVDTANSIKQMKIS